MDQTKPTVTQCIPTGRTVELPQKRRPQRQQPQQPQQKHRDERSEPRRSGDNLQQLQELSWLKGQIKTLRGEVQNYDTLRSALSKFVGAVMVAGDKAFGTTGTEEAFVTLKKIYETRK